MLRTVWYKIEENRTVRSEQIFRTLTEKGIPCRRFEQEERMAGERREIRQSRNKQRCPGAGRKGIKNIEKIKLINAERGKETEDLCHMLLLTDDRALVRRASQEKIACVGVAGADTDFFEGADFVVEDPEELELRELEEYLCHCHGIPVTIAQTERLILREMVKDDWQVLDRVSRQRGMEKARRDAEEDDAFGKERLASYISSQYRLYGYGLWTVALADNGGQPGGKTADESEKIQKSREEEAAVLQNCSRNVNEERTETIQQIIGDRIDEQSGSVIGCCGFSELNENLELQYMLDEAYRRQGYGTEMCSAAISYAYEYLEAKEIWVRVRSDYPETLSFAHSLGFRPIERETKLLNREGDAGEAWSENGGLYVKIGMEDTEAVCNKDFFRKHTSGLVSSASWHIVWLRHEKPYF